MAGDARSLYALGVAPPETVAATATRSTGTGGATAPATKAPPPQSPRPVLYLLAGDKWTPLPADWPKEAGGSEDLASVHVIGGVPHLAAPVGTAGDAVRIYRLVRESSSAAWMPTDDEVVKVGAPPRFVKLLNSDERPALWVQGTAAGEALGSLWSRKHGLAKVQFSGVAPKAEDVDVTVASDVRLFFRRDGKPYEQHFNWDGIPSGPAAPLDWTRLATNPSINWLTTAFMTVLAVLLVSTLLRRRSMGRDDERGEPEE
jgi:hypothetical protein